MRPEKKSKEAKKRGEAGQRSQAQTETPANVPPILREGDLPAAPQPSGPGQRYDLGQAPPPPARPVEETAELPEGYGTKRLLLTARDPRWLYAHWDLTREQLRHYNSISADGHLVLRIYKEGADARPCVESHVHPESKNWFVNVPDAGTRYLAELGYYEREKGDWSGISRSAATPTPPDALSKDVSVWFETLPAEIRFREIFDLVRSAAKEHMPLMLALQEMRESGSTALPAPEKVSAGHWTPEQERALGELIKMDAHRRVWVGSLEITELVQRQLQQELYSAAAAQFGLGAWSGELAAAGQAIRESAFSPLGIAERPQQGFWFKVNAELIIYGSTEPDAEVTIGGRPIKLRPDGTFSYRFALPDGEYDLPITATAADRSDGRSAALSFKRATEYSGDVGAHAQDPDLQPPRPENVA